jgi:hypothetical protein
MKVVKVKYALEDKVIPMYHLETIEDVFDYLEKFTPVLSIKLGRFWCKSILQGGSVVVNSATHYWCTPDGKSISILKREKVSQI